MMEHDKKKQIIKISALLGVFTIIFGVTYAFINVQLEGTKKQVITAGTLDLILEEDENNLTITDALPMYDDVGMIQEPFTFRLINNVSTPTNYILKLTDITTGDKLPTSIVKYGLTKNGVGEPALLSTLPETGQIDAGVIGDKETIEYSLRLWIDSSVTNNSVISGKSLSYRIDVEVSQEIATESNQCPVLADAKPNRPELTSGMIPVTYNETDKTWVKADGSSDNWYDYSNQIWANAVTVTEDTRASYMALDAGEPISMDDINTMWVWIPRYSYTIKQSLGRNLQKCSELGEITTSSPAECRKVSYPNELRQEALAMCQGWYPEVKTEDDCMNFNELNGYNYDNFDAFIDEGILYGAFEDTRTLIETYPNALTSFATLEQPGGIDIKFIKANEIDNGTGMCENCAENWVTPQGFTFGEENIAGFWVGKFENSSLEQCDVGYSDNSNKCDSTELTLQVKPNVISWRGARLSTFFEASRLMQSADDNLTYNADTYGFDVAGTSSMDVHMLKNSEWGIVAYLSQSQYGKYGNSNYKGANKEVYQNKSTEFITGMSNGKPSQQKYAENQFTYDTPNTGYGASTTGTIYGVYDMSGGGSEFVMGNYNNLSGYDSYMNSGFCGTNGPTDGTCRQWPESKYYDLYTSDNPSVAYKFGDATVETFNWYGDYEDFVSKSPWFERGSDSNIATRAGIFSTASVAGSAHMLISSRLAIKP